MLGLWNQFAHKLNYGDPCPCVGMEMGHWLDVACGDAMNVHIGGRVGRGQGTERLIGYGITIKKIVIMGDYKNTWVF